RETRIHVEQPGYRSQSIIVVTSLLNHERTTKEDLAFLYLQRWHNELDLRSIKSTMQMDDLRCKTPELVRKEVWTHVLAYNLIRTLMAQAASEHDIPPRTISFKGTMQMLEAFQPLIELQGHTNSKLRQDFYRQLLACVASHRVGNRPGRFEPRKVKRRVHFHNFMTKPRHEMKLDMIKRVKET
ncbi:MAG: transposase, partial [Planctomycetota bacterium]